MQRGAGAQCRNQSEVPCQNRPIETSIPLLLLPPTRLQHKRDILRRVHVSDNDPIWKLFLRLSSWTVKNRQSARRKDPKEQMPHFVPKTLSIRFQGIV